MTEAQRQAAVWRAARQEQFLDVADRDQAEARFHAHLRLAPLGSEAVALSTALGRVLAETIVAPVDVPGFDRAGVDGFALRAADTVGATENTPRLLRLNHDLLTPGVAASVGVQIGTATVIATGGMVPRGADAVIMIEHTDVPDPQPPSTSENLPLIAIRRAVAPGQAIAAAGSDIGRGETVLRSGTMLTAREIGMLAALGLAEVPVWRQPRVAILSTGDEIVEPGLALAPGQVHDCNAALLAATVTELGGRPLPMGIIADDETALQQALEQALATADMVVLSGGTSKGAGDIASRVVGRLSHPGIVVHGVALKPGKPLCLAVTRGKPVVILPGFPTSAIFTFHEFVAPVLRLLAGRPPDRTASVTATLPVRVRSEPGRTEAVMVSLVQTGATGAANDGLAAYPLDRGSGSITSFARADGFIVVPALVEALAAGTRVSVRLIGANVEPADLTIIGSHCAGLELLIGRLERENIRVKALAVGSAGGLAAARRGECDVAGIHLLDAATGVYNRPFLSEGLTLIPGYGRAQGVVTRADDPRFADRPASAIVAAALAEPECLMINRNAGSATRATIDTLLGKAEPPGHRYQTRSHQGVAAAIVQGRADWGVAIEAVARQYGLGFAPVRDERYDFVIPTARLERTPVRRFLALLACTEVRATLSAMGFTP